MCGRYQFSLDSGPLRRIFERAQALQGPMKPKLGEIYPGDPAAVLVGARGEDVPRVMRWGYQSPRGRGLIINARAESAGERPMFRQSLLYRRCAVPASGFYEWDPARQKYLFSLPGEPLYMAGLYDLYEGEERFVILTTEANASMAGVHPRMPLVLTRDSLKSWLHDQSAAVGMLGNPPPPLKKKSEYPEQLGLYCAD